MNETTHNEEIGCKFTRSFVRLASNMICMVIRRTGTRDKVSLHVSKIRMPIIHNMEEPSTAFFSPTALKRVYGMMLYYDAIHVYLPLA